MPAQTLILGAGMVGSVIAADLAADPDLAVTVADRSPEALERTRARAPGVATKQADLSDIAALKKLLAPFDLVVGAVASVIGFQTLRAVIEAGKPFCDICFMPEDALELDALAKDKGVAAVVDCGVAPGMSNMIAGHAAATLDQCERIEIYVGGLPRERRWPFQYKAAFAPYDVIEEYTRPARLVEHGEVVVREALSEPEFLDLPGVGTLEAVNTDGLRSLAYTLRVPFMKEKTLRYPGHYDLMRAFRATGLFSQEAVDVRGARIRPIDVISALMFPKWTYNPGEEDLTIMRVTATGLHRGVRTRLTWDLLDFYDKATHATSMARTTAFPCAIVARMLARGEITHTGVIPPEHLAKNPGMLDRVLEELRARGVRYTAHSEPA